MAVSLPQRQTVRGVCPHDCPDTCGFVVTVEQGRAVDLRGDSDHPFTDGFLCVKVARYLERVYHPERLQWPLRRVGPKGAGAFVRISWDEALDELVRQVERVRSKFGPEAILPYSYAGTMGNLQYGSLDRRFFHLLGASLLDRTICATAGTVGSNLTLGTRAWIDPEAVRHSRYIINWGSNTSVTNMHLWAIMFQARKKGAKIVTIDPHRSKTAARSDWWLPIRPGTDAALALGLMHVLFRDGLADRAFLRDHCLGADALEERVAREFTTDQVSAITGLHVADIEKLAHEYGTTRPAFIRLNYGLQRHRGGGMAARTVCVLPAVVGAWRDVGGGALLSTSKAYELPTDRLERPDLAPPAPRTVNMVQLAEALNDNLPGPPVRLLFVYNSNPAAVCPDQQRVLAGLARPELFTVVHDQFLTDTARYADLVLPATTQLEHFDIHHSYGHLYVQANLPAVPPLAEARPNTELFRLLAQRLGMPKELFPADDRELAAELLAGHTGDHPLAGITLERLLEGGPVRLNLPSDVAPFASGRFPTPEGQCRIFNPDLAEAGLDPLPAYTPPAEDPLTQPDLARRFPLQFVTPPHPAFLNSTFVNVDSLRAQAGRPTLEIHPVDAEPRRIATGDPVRIWNDRGEYFAHALVGPTVARGTVAALGLWWREHTRGGFNCNATTSTRLTDFGGGATFFDNLVEVARVAPEAARS